MEKLELKHLAPYLPYRVKCEWQRKFDKQDIVCTELTLSDAAYLIERDNFKLHLRTLSDLTKEIEHNGERFVPAKILWRLGAEGTTRPFIKPPAGWYEGELSISQFEDTGCQVIQIDPDDVNQSCLEISWCGKDADIAFCQSSATDKISLTAAAFNQYNLFAYLFEWHFDVFGLIDKGLAVDVNTIKHAIDNA